MKRVAKIRSVVIAAVILAAGSLSFALTSPASADTTDCDANAVIYCGASSVTALQSDYQNGKASSSAASIQHVYSYFGINSSDVSAMPSDAQSGSVTSGGDVYVGSKLVASDAITAGRQNLSNSCGSSTKVTVQSTTFYTRAPCVSFASSPLSAYVFMKNGVFQFAILKSCGNPVKATPKTTPKPAPTPVPATTVTPAPKPTTTTTSASVCSGNNTNSGLGNAGNCDICSGVNNCTTTVTTPTPSASGECSSMQLSVNPTNPLDVTAAVAFQAQNGAQLQSITYDFGDSQAIPATTTQNMEHIYAQGGNYVVKATLAFSGDTTDQPSVCQAPLTVGNVQPTCDLLQVTPEDNQTATITGFQTSSNGGTFTGADINWGDGTIDNMETTLLNQSHQYTNPGTYTISVLPHFNVNGQDVTAAGNACQQQITITGPTVTTTAATTPTTPSTSLVNTGAGSVAGIFIGAAGVGTLGYRYLLRKRLSSNL